MMQTKGEISRSFKCAKMLKHNIIIVLIYCLFILIIVSCSICINFSKLGIISLKLSVKLIYANP